MTITIPANLDIRESLTELEGEKLMELVKMVARPGMRVVEVGSWKGFSTVYLAHAVSDYNGIVFAVDHWLGSPGAEHHQCAQSKDILAIFRRNMEAMKCSYFAKPMVMGSLTAASVFANRSLDMVFLDGDHRYTEFKADLEAWLPKLRLGGMLCGHDGSTPFWKQPTEVQEFIKTKREEDYLEKYQLHPGITLALHELLGDQQELAGTTCVWYWQKTLRGIWNVLKVRAKQGVLWK